MRTFRSDVEHERPPVVHEHASLVLYLAGHAQFWMQGTYTLRTGDVLLVPAGMPHQALASRGVRAIGLSLCPTCMPASTLPLFDAVRGGSCAVRHLAPTERRRLERTLDDLERELALPDGPHELALGGYLALIAVAILRADDGGAATQRSPWSPVVSQALEVIHRRAVEGISLRDVAAHVSRSAPHVASLVKEATGETVVGWITRVRMSQSRQLLTHTDASGEQIAERCGFASPSHFYRAFKRAHGMPPGEWRRSPRP